MNDKNSSYIFIKVNLSSYAAKFNGMNLINFLFYQINFLMLTPSTIDLHVFIHAHEQYAS